MPVAVVVVVRALEEDLVVREVVEVADQTIQDSQRLLILAAAVVDQVVSTQVLVVRVVQVLLLFLMWNNDII